MNKAKIILISLGLFSIIGGALAFKAAKFGQGGLFYTTTTGGGQTTCTLHPRYRPNTTVGATTTTAPSGLYYSKNAAGICVNPVPVGATIYVAPVQ
jgi:hypothetical protein